jgi:MFS family permease
LILAILVLFLAALTQGVTVPLLPSLSNAGADQAQLLGLVYGAHGAMRIAAQPFGGLWVDRAGGRRVLAAAAFLCTLSLAGFLFTTSPMQSLVLRGLGGVSSGFAHPAAFAVALEGVAAERQGRRLSTVLAVGATGMVLGPVLAALFATNHLRLPLVIALVPAAAVAAFLGIAAISQRADKAVATSTAVARGTELKDLRSLLLDVTLLATIVPIAFNKLTFSAFQALLPIYGSEVLGLDRRGVSLVFLVTGVAFAAVQPLGGRLVDRFSPRRFVIALTPVLVAVLFALAFVSGRTSFLVGYVLYIVVATLVFVAALKLLATHPGASTRMGAVYGGAATLTDPFTAIGPIVFMSAYAHVHTYTFALMAAFGLVTGVAFVRGTAAR